MTRFTERIIAALIILFLLTYVGYQAYRFAYKPVETETVYEYTVAHSVGGKGIALREELILDGIAQGVEYYLYDDATRVAIGETVAEFYRSSAGDKNIKRVRELEKEIRLLREAQDSTVTNFGNTEIYNRNIKEQLGKLSGMSSTGRYRDMLDMRQQLTTLMNKKQISTGRVLSFDSRIGELEAQLQGLQRSASSETVTSVTAPVSGYFSQGVDGYEAMAASSILKDCTQDDLTRLIAAKAPNIPSGKVGKMVLSQNWYFVAEMDKYEVENVRPNQPVYLQFDQISEAAPAVIHQIFTDKNKDTSVIVFLSDQMSSELINLRTSNVVVRFQQHSGLRINSKDLRFLGDQRGVYVLEDRNIVRFRQIEPVYEDKDFVLSKVYYVNSQETRYVKLFDQLIVKGNDLYDGKPIQDS